MLAEIPLYSAACPTLFLGLLIIACRSALTAPSVRIDTLHLRLLARLWHFIFLQTV
jgi:hypothetical protein